MNNKKLEELQDDVIEALENALSEISQFKAGADTWFYLSIKNCLMYMDEAKEHLENIQNKLGEETKEGQ